MRPDSTHTTVPTANRWLFHRTKIRPLVLTHSLHIPDQYEVPSRQRQGWGEGGEVFALGEQLKEHENLSNQDNILMQSIQS